MDALLPKNKLPIIRVPARPADVNAGGSIFGGWIMSYVDIAGSVPAMVRARGAVVTRAVDSFEFKKPVFVDDLVSFYAEIVEEGSTSITIKVEVYAQRSKKGNFETIKVTEAQLVYVAIDGNGLPRALPDIKT